MEILWPGFPPPVILRSLAVYIFHLLTYTVAENCLPVVESPGVNCQLGRYRSRGRAERIHTRTYLVGDPHHQRDLPTELLPVLEAGKEGAEGAPGRSRRGKTQSISVREGAERARLGRRREQCWSSRHWDRLCCLC